MSRNQEWSTPPEFIQAVESRFGKITIDVAATHENKVVPSCLTPEMDGLKLPWFASNTENEIAWCNPGFSNMRAWVDKAIAEVSDARDVKSYKTILLLGLAAPSTKWWLRIMGSRATSNVIFLSPRVQFIPALGIKKSSNPRESALFVFTNQWNGNFSYSTWQWKQRYKYLSDTLYEYDEDDDRE